MMSNEREDWLDSVARGNLFSGGKNLRVFWNGVPHEDAPEHPEDKNWADSEPDPKAP
jgi:hypothetical protein